MSSEHNPWTDIHSNPFSTRESNRDAALRAHDALRDVIRNQQRTINELQRQLNATREKLRLIGADDPTDPSADLPMLELAS